MEHGAGAKREGKGALKRLASEPGLLVEWLSVSSHANKPTLHLDYSFCEIGRD